MSKMPYRLPYPTGLLVDIHSFCNGRCIICPYPTLSKTNAMGNMEWDLYKKIVNDFKSLMDKYRFRGKIAYCQMGEPFIQKDIIRWVQYAIDKRIIVYFNTNGSLLSSSVVDDLIDIGFDGIFNISFHAFTKDLYQKIMGLDYDNSIRNINYLLSRYPKQNIIINAVPFQWSSNEKNKLINFWSQKEVKVTVSRLQSRCGLVPVVNKIEKKRISGCQTERIFYEMVIAYNGDVLLCCHDMAREVVLGNLNIQTISEVWDGKKFQNIIEKIYSGQKLNPDFLCNRCEESASYWSARQIIKNILPDFILKKIQKHRNREWIVASKD